MNLADITFSGRKGEFVAFFSGTIIPFSFAPYNLWPLGIIGPTLLAMLLSGLNEKRSFFRALVFGLGLFISGASWVYVSIHDFGFASPPLAILLTGIFVTALALAFAVPFYFYARFIQPTSLNTICIFPAFWVVGEWSRTWFLTGFPWLFSGYAHIETWLSGWAPIFGVFGLSYLTVFSGVALALLISSLYQRAPKKIIASLTCSLIAAVFWLSGAQLANIEWTSYDKSDEITVSLVQPNIPLQMKWDPKYQPFITETLLTLSEPNWKSDIVIWPEAAIPYLHSEAPNFLAFIAEQAQSSNTMLITGMLYDTFEQEEGKFKYYNSILGLGAAEGTYFKQRLVPFGEYVPLENHLRGLIAFFDLPNSVIHKGPKQTTGLTAKINDKKTFRISPYICYEIVYPDLVAENARQAEVLVTISNDAWFGDSVGPIQHFEMAQMRALENGRFVIRSTNTGLSGLIDHKGKIILLGNQFHRESITGSIYRTHGQTPYSQWYSRPIIVFCFLIIFVSLIAQKRKTVSNKSICRQDHY